VFNCYAWAKTAVFMTMLRSDFARLHGHLASFCMVPVLVRTHRASVSAFVSDKAAEFRTLCACVTWMAVPRYVSRSLGVL
jgi:hypothetical protein